MKPAPETKWQRYTRQITEEFLQERARIGQMTPELLVIFAGGHPKALKQVAEGLSKMAPEDPDLSILYAVYHQMVSSSPEEASVAGPGKGRRPVYSLPLKDIPSPLLERIERGTGQERLREHLTYTLREILGAARRAGIPEELNHDALAAYMFELEMRDISAKTLQWKLENMQRLGGLFHLEVTTRTILNDECRAAGLVAKQTASKRHAAFRAAPLSPLDYARLAQATSREAFATSGNRQTVHRLFITAAALALLSFLPERVSDILGMVVGEDVKRDARGWTSEYFSRKTDVDRTFDYLPDQLTPFLDDLILLGAEPGAQGRDLARLYRQRAAWQSPLFARTNLRKAYSRNRIFELVQERTGHGPHAARKAMTDYLAEIDASPEDVLDLLGHRHISTSQTHYAIRAEAHQRKRTLRSVDHLRADLSADGAFRLPTGRMVDLDRISQELDQTVARDIFGVD